MIVSLPVFDINNIKSFFQKFLFNVAEAIAWSAEDPGFNQLLQTLYSNICANISTIRSKKGYPDEILF